MTGSQDVLVNGGKVHQVYFERGEGSSKLTAEAELTWVATGSLRMIEKCRQRKEPDCWRKCEEGGWVEPLCVKQSILWGCPFRLATLKAVNGGGQPNPGGTNLKLGNIHVKWEW